MNEPFRIKGRKSTSESRQKIWEHLTTQILKSLKYLNILNELGASYTYSLKHKEWLATEKVISIISFQIRLLIVDKTWVGGKTVYK